MLGFRRAPSCTLLCPLLVPDSSARAAASDRPSPRPEARQGAGGPTCHARLSTPSLSPGSRHVMPQQTAPGSAWLLRADLSWEPGGASSQKVWFVGCRRLLGPGGLLPEGPRRLLPPPSSRPQQPAPPGHCLNVEAQTLAKLGFSSRKVILGKNWSSPKLSFSVPLVMDFVVSA